MPDGMQIGILNPQRKEDAECQCYVKMHSTFILVVWVDGTRSHADRKRIS